MVSRDDYLNGKATHREYFAQFVTPRIKAWVRKTFSLELLLETDRHLNTPKITHSLGGTYWVWDNAPVNMAKLKEVDRMAWKPDATCVAKEAAIQVLEEEGYFWNGEKWASKEAKL